MQQIFIRLLSMLVAMTILIATATAAPSSSALRWETVETVADGLSTADRFDVAIVENYIYVYTPEPTTVKVFTILGQLISQAELKEGVSRMKVSARGIYILKSGSVTRRITL